MDSSSGPTRRPKELSFYKKSTAPYSSSSSSPSAPNTRPSGTGSVGSFSARRDPLDRLDDRSRRGKEKEREQDRGQTGGYTAGEELRRVKTRDEREGYAYGSRERDGDGDGGEREGIFFSRSLGYGRSLAERMRL